MKRAKPARNPRRMAAAVMVGYVAVIVVGKLMLPRHPKVIEALPFALAAIGLVSWALLAPARAIRQRADDVFRHDLVESTSIAFFVTMGAAVTWGLCEAYLGAPRISAWWVWLLGCGSWAVAGWRQRSTRDASG
jgi:hypothetical protein